jgi:hypothetical protein
MILHAEERQVFVAHALVGVVIEINVGDLDVARGQRFWIDAEAMILRGDFDFFSQQIFDRVVRTVMPKFQFESFSAECESAKLMTKANPKHRDAAKELPDIL